MWVWARMRLCRSRNIEMGFDGAGKYTDEHDTRPFDLDDLRDCRFGILSTDHDVRIHPDVLGLDRIPEVGVRQAVDVDSVIVDPEVVAGRSLHTSQLTPRCRES